MPSVNPQPQNVADLVEAGALDFAASLYARGLRGAVIDQSLRRIYPNAYTISIRALRARARAASAAAASIRSQPSSAPVSAAQAAYVEGLGPGVTLTFEVTYKNPRSGTYTKAYVDVTNAAGLSLDEAKRRAYSSVNRGEFRYPSRLVGYGIADEDIKDVVLIYSGES